MMNADLLRPAGLGQRVKAFALDYLVIAGYLVIIVLVGVGCNRFFPTLTQKLFTNRYRGQGISFLLVTLPVTLYYALLESSPQQATWGKRKNGLSVVDTDGKRLTFARALGRTLLKFIPWELTHTLIWQLRVSPPEATPLIDSGFAVVWLLILANLINLWMSKMNQTLYDRLAATYVLRSEGRPQG